MGYDLNTIGDTIGDGVKKVGDVAQNSTEKFHEQFISEIEPIDGKFGNAAMFAAEMVPGVSEYNSIRKGDWEQLAIDVAIDGGMIAVGVATAGLGTGALVGARVGSKLALKGASEVGEVVAKKAIKEGAEAITEKTIKEGSEVVTKKVAKEMTEEVSEKVAKETGEKVVDEVTEKVVKNSPLDGSGGHWDGDRGNSLWKPDDDFVPLKNNADEKTWAEINKEYNIDGIRFKDGEPGFSEISKGTVKIDNFSSFRPDNFDKADIVLAKQKGITPGEVEAFRKENKLTWHERSDMGTMDLVPSKVHGNVSHSGGISEIKKLEGL